MVARTAGKTRRRKTTTRRRIPRAVQSAAPVEAVQAEAPPVSDVIDRLLSDEAQLSDADLGVGEDDEAPDALAALLADPKASRQLGALIDAAVEARIARMAPSAPTGENGMAFQAFLASIEKMLEMNAIQQPGYMKPIPPSELERRAEGHIEMMALLKQYRTAETPPHYYVGAGLFYTDCELIEEGEPIATYLPPVEDFEPINDEARQVMAAFFKSIGGATPGIGDQIAGAMAERRAGPRIVGEGMKDPSRRSGATTRLQSVERKEVIRPGDPFPGQGGTIMPAADSRPSRRNPAAPPRPAEAQFA